jgi:hypothetical protein
LKTTQTNLCCSAAQRKGLELRPKAPYFVQPRSENFGANKSTVFVQLRSENFGVTNKNNSN